MLPSNTLGGRQAEQYSKDWNEVLEKADSAQRILQDFQVLKIRLQNSLNPLEVDWSSPLDNRNAFLEQLRWNDVPALAELVSSKDVALLREYAQTAFADDGAQARSILGFRWNQLVTEVKQCMAAEIGLESQIDSLNQVFLNGPTFGLSSDG
ncbi:hypothetical protein N7509_008310 [Penicillium cosmopolitanum]|uniref:Uncharacterized protein n=1 Tax=Penicillium cosmopolitanum TaxID=1131564 RepID=A0A9W9VMD3_9EURO|nr:uncharacterized protein N7509_008310 [Penicillium cosmopolitanum]KAJ5385769.1 hypothetical protein N7509_008310 [Penicillium cosmopolitanum]